MFFVIAVFFAVLTGSDWLVAGDAVNRAQRLTAEWVRENNSGSIGSTALELHPRS